MKTKYSYNITSIRNSKDFFITRVTKKDSKTVIKRESFTIKNSELEQAQKNIPLYFDMLLNSDNKTLITNILN